MKLIPLGTTIRCARCLVAQLIIPPGNPRAVINGRSVITDDMVLKASMVGCPKKGPCKEVFEITKGRVPYMRVNDNIPVDEDLEVVTKRGPTPCEMNIPDRVKAL